MPSPGTLRLLHLLSLLVAVAADVARRLAGLARSASFRLSMRKSLLEVVSSTEQRDRELPVERYGKQYGAEQKAAAEHCAFCLSGIEEGDEVRVLRYRHLFHRCCLDQWLAARPWATCPLCRGELLTAATCAGEEQEEEEGFEGAGMVMFAAYVRRCRRVVGSGGLECSRCLTLNNP